VVFITTLLIFSNAFSQPYYFNRIIQNGSIWGVGMSVLKQGEGFVVAGIEDLPKKVYLRYIDVEGNVIWHKNYGEYPFNAYPGYYGSLSKTIDGAYILAGSLENTNLGENCGIVYKFSNFGDTLWTVRIIDTVRHSLVLNASGEGYDNTHMAVGSMSVGNAESDIVISNINDDGREIWRKSFDFGQSEIATTIITTPDSCYLIGGYRFIPGDYYSLDALIVKVDKDGNFLWKKYLGGPYWDTSAEIAIQDNGDIIVAFCEAVSQGPPYPVPPPENRVRLAKLDQQGELIWYKLLGAKETNKNITDMHLLKDGSIVAVGSGEGDSLSVSWKEGVIFKASAEGDSIWYREYYYNNEIHKLNQLFCYTTTNDNGFMMVGQYYDGNLAGSIQKTWLMRLDSAGCNEPGCDPTVQIERPKTHLQQILVYPNPALDFVTFELPEVLFLENQGSVIEIYDVFGKRVAGLEVQGESIVWNVKALSAGLYFYRCNTSETVFSGKFVVQ
jgi:Secretion system C-terminal sorting domain